MADPEKIQDVIAWGWNDSSRESRCSLLVRSYGVEPKSARKIARLIYSKLPEEIKQKEQHRQRTLEKAADEWDAAKKRDRRNVDRYDMLASILPNDQEMRQAYKDIYVEMAFDDLPHSVCYLLGKNRHEALIFLVGMMS